MIFNNQQLLGLMPLLIISVTIILIMLLIIWQRNHLVSFILTIVGFNLALFSLWFIRNINVIDITRILRVDNYSVFYIALIILASIATCIFAYPWLTSFPNNKDEFYLLVLIASIGSIIMVSSNHLLSLFIGVELLSLPLFGLIGYDFYNKLSLEAALKYTILSAMASSFLLFGIGLVYAYSGSLSFIKININNSLNNDTTQLLLLVGLGMLIIGLGFKLSLVPFHIWTPDVYQGAPAPVSAFLSTASKIAVFGMIMRLFTCTSAINNEILCNVISCIAFTSILVGNLLAVTQDNIKRLLGYSSIAHIGYILSALVTAKSNQLLLETTGIYLVSYLFSNIGAFGVVSMISNLYRGSDMDYIYLYKGLFWRHPILSIFMTIMMLSLAGIPMTLGFIGKFYIIISGVNAHLWWLTAAVLIGSTIGLYYYLRIIVSFYLKPSELYVENKLTKWKVNSSSIVILISTILILLLGIYPQPLILLVELVHLHM